MQTGGKALRAICIASCTISGFLRAGKRRSQPVDNALISLFYRHVARVALGGEDSWRRQSQREILASLNATNRCCLGANLRAAITPRSMQLF